MSRLSTAVYGGSISFVVRVFLPYMFGNTQATIGFGTTLSERLGDAALADYIRWEYRPADRAQMIMSLRGGFVLGGFGQKPRRRCLADRIRARIAAGLQRSAPAAHGRRDPA